RARRCRPRVGIDGVLESAPRLRVISADLPEAQQRAGEPLLLFAFTGLSEQIERGAKVVMLGLEPVEALLGSSDGRLPEVGRHLLSDGQEVLGVPPPEVLALAGVLQPLGGELAD